MSIDISIIVPVYNTEEFLPYCLDSLIGQTFKNIEIIVVNDNSPGNCTEIMLEYCAKDSRIQFINLPQNVGTLHARFAGFKVAKGKYIQSVDSDDELFPNACEVIYVAMEESQATICHIAAHIYMHPDRNRPPNWDQTTKDIFTPKLFEISVSEWIELLTKPSIDNCMCMYVVRYELINKMVQCLEKIVINKKIIMLEDFLQIFTISSLAEGRVISLNKKLYNYRLGVGIMSSQHSLQKWANNVNNILYVFDIISKMTEKSLNYTPKTLENLSERKKYDINHFINDFFSFSFEEKKEALTYIEDISLFIFYLCSIKNSIFYISNEEQKILNLYYTLIPKESIRRKILSKLFKFIKKIKTSVRNKCIH
ncbi:MAG: glycosyltransferase family 2 protein [Brevinema sp.]